LEKNKYRQTIEKVIIPPGLKEDTRRMIFMEIKKRKNIRTIRMVISVAAAVILVTGAGIWALSFSGIFSGAPDNQPGNKIPLEMEFNFVSVPENTQPVRMAHAYPLRQTISLDEMSGVLPTGAPEGFDDPVGSITLFFSEPSETPDAILGEAFYWIKNVNLVTVTFTDGAMIYIPLEISGSFVGDVQVGIGYSGSDDRLFAVYEMNGLTYILTAERITRQEFTQVVVHFISPD